MNPKSPLLPALALGALLLAGCATRSISNSGFDAAHGPGRQHRYAANPTGYAGELSEFDVLGVRPESAATDADIQAALRDSAAVRLARSSKILLIQSGADFPDAPMFDALRQRFAVAGFSGKPAGKDFADAGYSRSLRLAAARGGYDKIVCYWGVLESGRKNNAAAVVSWLPIVGHVLPDERQEMRIRLKAAIVDVASGRWTLLAPPPSQDSSLSAIVSRRAVDQELVASLKERGYRDLAQLLTEHYTE